jgi:hypothetical protein
MLGFPSTFAADERRPPAEAVVEGTAARLVAMFDLRACWYEPFPFDRQLPRIEPGRIVVPGDEPGIEPWTLDGGVELPVRSGDLTLGRFVLAPAERTVGTRLSPRHRAEAIEIAAHVGDVVASALRSATLS